MGCGRPIKLGLFGPFRNWLYARNFRSTSVKKAMVIKRATERIIVLRKALYIGKGFLSKRDYPILGL